MTLEAAQSAIASVVQPSDAQHAPYVISVVDGGGNLIYLERADGAPSGMRPPS
ncbi:heme-binding protein [Pseudomonas sp.]|uniref:heme-binding protein n=1 Tax=Pseudomonas sp. TaxID=306 RepID=UPI00338FB177